MTTNNRMELMGVISALQTLKIPTTVKLFTDSQYIVNAINQHWLEGWKRRGWSRSDGQLLNKELWQELDRLLSIHNVTFTWVKGHAHNPLNNRADQLAVTESTKYASMPKQKAPSKPKHPSPSSRISSGPTSSPSRHSPGKLRCPFCGGTVHVTVHDGNGTRQDDDYELFPWNGIRYGLAHNPDDEVDFCPIAREGTLGRFLYESREAAVQVWKTKH